MVDDPRRDRCFVGDRRESFQNDPNLMELMQDEDFRRSEKTYSRPHVSNLYNDPNFIKVLTEQFKKFDSLA